MSKGQGKCGHFQVQLSGRWADYQGNEDRILKRAYLAGFPNARYTLRGQTYEVDFKGMTQKNQKTGKGRSIRPPHRWKPPAAPICQPGPTTCIKVPEGAPGTTIQVPHPRAKGQYIAVDVPVTARAGQAMLVPVPAVTEAPPMPSAAPEPAAVPEPSAPPAPSAASAPSAPAPAPKPAPPEKGGKKGWSTGAKVAAGVTGAAAVGGLAVAGVVLGEHIAEEGWDAAIADVGDWFEGAGETIADGAEAAVDWVGDAADATGDFVMDLF